MSSQSGGYYLPAPSHWPIIGSIGLFLMAFGAALTMNAVSGGGYVLSAGALVMVYMLFGWFGTVIRESESGKFNKQVDVSFRWSMGWFIFSEVMFFACFFGALFYMRVLSIPWLAEGDTESLLWSGFSASWPTAGPGVASKFTPMGAWGLPAINTALLLTSGVTLTIAHWALLKGQRMKLHVFMFLTIVLGVAFLALQAEEYMHAYTELDLTLESGAYGATFYMLTGFHGFHVTIGTIMLIVIWLRGIRGHFKPEAHFGFEGVAWYWHFVDVVWLALFVLVYWL
ncbi:MAG: cytochrome c oxidase subunit 3 [Proteobacteria bacterium]|nr:cytochrome c oxidase subunit 3 [Pseudomonadota bacterium]